MVDNTNDIKKHDRDWEEIGEDEMEEDVVGLVEEQALVHS